MPRGSRASSVWAAASMGVVTKAATSKNRFKICMLCLLSMHEGASNRTPDTMRTFFLRDGLVDDRRRGLQLLDIEDHVLLDRVVERIAAEPGRCLDRRTERRHQRRQMTRQRGAVPDGLDGGLDRAAGPVAQHHQERNIQDRDAVFEARDRFVIGEVAGHPAHEQVAAAGVESIFGRDARIGATEDRGERILPLDQRFTFGLEIVPPRHALDIAAVAGDQQLQRFIRT